MCTPNFRVEEKLGDFPKFISLVMEQLKLDSVALSHGPEPLSLDSTI